LTQQIMSKKQHVGGFYAYDWSVGSRWWAMTWSENELFVYDWDSPNIKIWTGKGKLLGKETLEPGVEQVAATKKYFCAYFQGEIRVKNRETQHTKKWTVLECQGLTIHEELIYVVGSSFLVIYSLEGMLLDSWMLRDNRHSEHKGRRITVYQNKIFVLDIDICSILVFSKQGQLLHEWGQYGIHPGNFKLPLAIAVAHDLVYVSDPRNYRIQAFSLEGEFRFQIPYFGDPFLSDLVALDHMLYASNMEKRAICAFQLTYI
jgi:hypothetical protein